MSKINDVNIAKELMSGKPAKVRKYFEQTIKIMLSGKDFVSAAVAFNPYAATAWTGVCFILPVGTLVSFAHQVYAAIANMAVLSFDSCY